MRTPYEFLLGEGFTTPTPSLIGCDSFKFGVLLTYHIYKTIVSSEAITFSEFLNKVYSLNGLDHSKPLHHAFPWYRLADDRLAGAASVANYVVSYKELVRLEYGCIRSILYVADACTGADYRARFYKATTHEGMGRVLLEAVGLPPKLDVAYTVLRGIYLDE